MSSQPAPDQQQTRAGRVLLTRKAIVVAALELIDAEGLELFSTRKLGAAVGVEAMSIYHHFKSKALLLDAVADHLISLAEPATGPSGDWKGRMRQTAWSYYALAKAHPRAFALLAGRRLNGQAAFAWMESVLTVLGDAGLDPQLQAKAFRAMGSLINGAGMVYSATIEASGRDHPMNVFALGADYPHLGAVAPLLGLPELDGLFDFGLEAVLQGVEHAIAKR